MARRPTRIDNIRSRQNSNSPNPFVQRGLCRKTRYTNENNEVIEIDYDDLKTIKELGSGQYGIVFKSVHTKSNLVVALKRINCTSENEERKQEIMDLEVPLKAGNSEFIVKFYGGLFAESYIWILSEVMDTSLDKFYAKAKSLVLKLDESFVAKVAYSCLMGISFLRSKNIMHRDIKPSNILMNRNGTIKLCDFGISGFINNSVCLTITGCCPYMAPEKIMTTDPDHNDGYTIKADIWSLGISLFEIATYKHPFEDAKTYCAKISAITAEEPPSLPNSFSDNFKCFIDMCLKRDPDERGDLTFLLNHAFIVSNAESQLDLIFIERIINEIERNEN